MRDMTKNKKDINYLKNTANNKTPTAQCLPPPGHVRN
jgi:hypothetical protein